jgi:hypothetical protein
MTEPFTISPAHYAKGKVIVRALDGRDGYKGRASYLIEALGGRYVGRSRGYHMSPAGAEKLQALYAAGFYAHMRIFADSPAIFHHPDRRELGDLTAAQALKIARGWVA